MASPRDASIELPDLGQQISARLAQAPGVIDRRFSGDRVQRLESLASGLPLLDIVLRRWSAGEDETQRGSSELPYVVTPRPAVPNSPAPSPAASREVPAGQVRKLSSPLAAAPTQLPVQRLPAELADLPAEPGDQQPSAIGSALAPSGPQAAMPIVPRLAGGPSLATPTLEHDNSPPTAAGSEKTSDAGIVSREAQHRLDPPATTPAPKLQAHASMVQRSSSVVPGASSTAQDVTASNTAGAPAAVSAPVSPPAVPPTPRPRERPQLVRLSSGGGPPVAIPIARQGSASPDSVSAGESGGAEGAGPQPGSLVTPEQRIAPALSVPSVSERSSGAMPWLSQPIQAQPKVAEGTLIAPVAAQPGGQLPPARALPASGVPGVTPGVDVPEAVAMRGRTQPDEHLSAATAPVAERPADSAGLTAAGGSAAPAVRAGIPVSTAPASANLAMAPAGSPRPSGLAGPAAMVMPSREYPASVQARTEPVSSLGTGARDLPWSGPLPARLPDAGYPAAAPPVQLGAPASEFVLARRVEPGAAETIAVQREEQTGAGSDESGTASRAGRTTSVTTQQPSGAEPARPPSQEIDLERLTDQVMILLEQRLTVERERLGL